LRKNLKETTLQNNRSRVLFLKEDNFERITYLKESTNMHNNKIKRYSNIYEEDITEQFKIMQNSIMLEQIPILTKLLMETDFDSGYESMAEIYFNTLFKRYGIIADTILQNIYLQNMYNQQHLLKHLLFIVANLPVDRRGNLEIIPLAGISNPDNEIQDLSVKCFEAWEDKRHIPTLANLRDKTTIGWFRDYISDVIATLEEG
jgi:hypothetical protein